MTSKNDEEGLPPLGMMPPDADVADIAAATADIAAAATAEEEPPAYGTNDVISGRGGVVNTHMGNVHLRSLCVKSKAAFDAGSNAAKRQIATDIVSLIKSLDPPGRFLRRQWDMSEKKAKEQGLAESKGPWVELNHEKCIQKTMQVMRDFERPDRVNKDGSKGKAKGKVPDPSSGAKRKRGFMTAPDTDSILPDAMKEQQVKFATMMEEALQASASAEASGVPELDSSAVYKEGCGPDDLYPTDHDVLSGRGAFINEHAGNKFFRTLALDQKEEFDKGGQDKKKAIAANIVKQIYERHPPGRFLRKVPGDTSDPPASKTDKAFYLKPRGFQGPWEVMTPDESRSKAVQALRDLRREKTPKKPRSKKTKKAEEAPPALPEGAATESEDVVKVHPDDAAEAVEEATNAVLANEAEV